MIKKTILFLFFSLYISCNNEKKYELILVENLELPKEEYVNSNGLTNKFADSNGTSFLYYRTPNIHTYNSELLIYDLNSKKIQKKLIYSKENGFNKSISSFVYINKDSILVTSMNDSLYITDANQKILKKLKFSFNDNGNEMYQLTNYLYNPIEYIKGSLYFTPNFYDEKKESYNNKKFIYKYNLKNDKLTVLPYVIPKNFIDSDYFSPYYYSCFNETNMIYAPANSHSFWVINIKTGVSKEYSSKSNYFREFKKYSNKEEQLTMKDYNFINCYYSRYSTFAYDKYRNLYYRFFYPGHDISKDSKNTAELNRNPEKISIIIFDKNFNVIGETLFENKNLSNTYFISPEGLYVGMNPKNELTDNKQLRYAKIKLRIEKN